MNLNKLQRKIKKVLGRYSFDIVNEAMADEKFVIIAKFGKGLDKSTFFINKQAGVNGLLIGANLAMSESILKKSIQNTIHLIASQYNVSSAPPTYKDDEATISLQMTYNYLKFNDKDFMLYVYNFKNCIMSIYNDIQRFLQHDELPFLDLSMFEGVDWTIFDPYIYIEERDRHFDGSWDKYISTLKDSVDEEDDLTELLYVEMCKSFEETNNMPIDVACEYIIEKAMSSIDEDKKRKLAN